jgi:alpha/beta superfamily hydrolase
MPVIIDGIKGIYEKRGNISTLLCPPHPDMGGSMFDVRLERICNELNKANVSTLRFDYRSVESAVEDARICLQWLKDRHDIVAVVGYSFGSVVASSIADDADLLILISPLKSIEHLKLRDSRIPKLIIYARFDQIVSLKESKEIANSLSQPKEVVELDTDHFYFGKFDVLARTVREFIERRAFLSFSQD